MADGSPNTGATSPASEPSAPRVFRAGDVLCRADELEDPGSKGPFLVVFDGEETEIFLVRKNGNVYGYINVCPHRYMPLNWKDDSFLTFDKAKILCVVHAAIFEVEDGSCVTMHCMDGLSPVALAVENGEVRLIDPGTDPAGG